MSTLNVPGAQLSYEVEGSGPLLILIPGASGVGEVFRQVARELSVRYQVVTYDRRGFSRSQLDGPQDYDHRHSTDADDVRRLIEHLTDKPATVFGNSSGAIVALEVLTHYPERVQTVVAHEPPIVLLLPDAAKWLAFFDGVYDTYRKDGVQKAMSQFASGIVSTIQAIVLSHGHTEHTHGLDGFLDKLGKRRMPILLHPDAFLKCRIIYNDNSILELPPPSLHDLEREGIELLVERGPSFVINDKVLVTGQIERTTDFEQELKNQQAEIDEIWQPDPWVYDNQAIVINVRNKGLVVATGYGHAGVINILRQV